MAVFIDCSGIKINWLGSIKTPITAEISGNLNFLRNIGILVGRRMPYWIELWGIVGDIIGSKAPLQKKGVNKLLNPNMFVKAGAIPKWVLWGE